MQFYSSYKNLFYVKKRLFKKDLWSVKKRQINNSTNVWYNFRPKFPAPTLSYVQRQKGSQTYISLGFGLAVVSFGAWDLGGKVHFILELGDLFR